MNTSEIQAALRDSGFLRDAAEEHLSRVAAISNPVEFGAGETILREGDATTDVFVILSGSVSIEICAPSVGCRRILTLVDGDLVGWSAVLEQGRSTATARANTPTLALAINGCQLQALCEHDPALGYAFMRRVAFAMSHRLTATRMQLLNVFGTQMPEAPQPPSGQTSSEQT